MIILILSAQSYAQRLDTIAYKNSFIVIHYNNNNQIDFYENSFFMKKDSLWKRTFYSKGKIRKKANASDTLYNANLFLEINESYYQNGNIKSIWYNKPPKKIGLISIWSMDSTYISYYPNGQVSDSLFYVNNKLVGSAKHYYENGQVAYEVEYKEGRLYKIVEYFDKNGNSLDIGTFKNGTGVWNKYDENGQMTMKETYKNGKMKSSTKIPHKTN